MSKSRTEITGQSSLYDSFRAPSDSNREHEDSISESTDKEFKLAFTAEASRFDSLRQLYVEADTAKQNLMFNTDSLRRIALWDGRYADYMTGARRKVVESDKWRGSVRGGVVSTVDDQGEDTEMSIDEFLSEDRRNQLNRNLGAAHINADSGLRQKIASQFRQTDMSQESDPRGDKQGIPARLRNAKLDGVLAPLTFFADIKSNDRLRGQLDDFATLIDVYHYHTEHVSQEALLKQALSQPHASVEAARYAYSLGELWVTHTQLLHEVWSNALARYNEQFPNRPIDPNDPTFFVRRDKS